MFDLNPEIEFEDEVQVERSTTQAILQFIVLVEGTILGLLILAVHGTLNVAKHQSFVDRPSADPGHRYCAVGKEALAVKSHIKLSVMHKCRCRRRRILSFANGAGQGPQIWHFTAQVIRESPPTSRSFVRSCKIAHSASTGLQKQSKKNQVGSNPDRLYIGSIACSTTMVPR